MSSVPDKSKLHADLEACRPGSDDLNLPELAALADAMADDAELEQRFASVQRYDTALMQAFQDVPPPEGLQQRLLAAVAADDDAPPSGAAPAEEPAPTPRPAAMVAVSRRWILVGGVAASMAVVLTAVVSLLNRQPPASADQIVSTTVQQHAELAQADWKVGETAPGDRPAYARLDRDVEVRGWTNVAGLGDSDGVAYRCVLPRGTTATLFVFRPREIDPQLPLAPLNDPDQSSGVTVGVWRSEGLVYALVVNGGVRQYRGFIRSSSIAACQHILPSRHHA